METQKRAPLQWCEDLEQAPRFERVWLTFGARTYKGPWQRIAQRIGNTWWFDSNQVNMWFYRAQFSKTGENWNEKAKERTINAWAHLSHQEEQDPANLGPPRRNVRIEDYEE